MFLSTGKLVPASLNISYGLANYSLPPTSAHKQHGIGKHGAGRQGEGEGERIEANKHSGWPRGEMWRRDLAWFG